MRVHLRFNHKFSIFLILIAAMGVEAFAQGRGRGAVGATNGFYRFNYGAGRDAADQLPGAADRHAAPDHAAQRDHPVHRARRIPAHPPCHHRRHRGTSVLRLLFQERRHRQVQAAGLVPVQRRTRRGHRLAAHGRLRPQDGEDGAERPGHAAAVHLRRQSQLPAGYRRPGVHRRHGHGLQPSGQARLTAPISAAWRTIWRPSASSSAAS